MDITKKLKLQIINKKTLTKNQRKTLQNVLFT